MTDKHPTSLEKLKEDIDKVKKYGKESSDSNDDKEAGSGAVALRAGLELFSGVVAGAMLGYFIDKWLDSFPLFFIICFLLGAAGGMLNIYRLMQDS